MRERNLLTLLFGILNLEGYKGPEVISKVEYNFQALSVLMHVKHNYFQASPKRHERNGLHQYNQQDSIRHTGHEFFHWDPVVSSNGFVSLSVLQPAIDLGDFVHLYQPWDDHLVEWENNF